MDAIAYTFVQLAGDEGNGFRKVELEAACESFLGKKPSLDGGIKLRLRLRAKDNV